MRPLLQAAEIRTIAADSLWMSPEYGRDTVALHFTWVRDQPAVEEFLLELEAALAPFEARPHWSKLFMARSDVISSLYERLPDFRRLVERLDPRGAFRNDWFEAHIRASG
jgi:xylitol oxidase